MGEWNNQYPDPISFSPGNLPQIITHRDLKKGGGGFIIFFFRDKSNSKVEASFPYRFSDAFVACMGVITFLLLNR